MSILKSYENSPSILFILGAGASVSSGVGVNNIPENINTEQIWEHLGKNMLPILSKTYKMLHHIAKKYPRSLFLTQNIDGLLIKAGVSETKVCEVHGHMRWMTCVGCQRKNITDVNTPKCKSCGSWCKPPIVMFGDKEYKNFLKQVSMTKPNYVVIIGTSLSFPYITELIELARKNGCNKIVNINPIEDEECQRLGIEQWCMDSDKGIQCVVNMVRNDNMLRK